MKGMTFLNGKPLEPKKLRGFFVAWTNFEKAVRGRADKKAEAGASPVMPWKN